MGSNNYRGEISHIADDIFINYSLNLPEGEKANTSGYFMKDAGSSQVRYSHFIVERGATTQATQTTTLQEIDRTTGNKTDNVLATIEWTNDESEDVYLGLITGYDPPSELPAEWAELAYPYYPCYISMASLSKPGMDKEPHTGKIELHMKRITELADAILTIHLPELPKTILPNDLKPFLYRHTHTHGSVANEPPQPEDVEEGMNLTVRRVDNTVVIGAVGETLPMGLYVVAAPTPAEEAANQDPSPYNRALTLA